MKERNSYFVYGISLSCTFSIPELPIREKIGIVDLYISEGEIASSITPDELQHEGWFFDQHVYIQVFQNSVFLSINNIGKIFISSKEIVLQRLPNTTIQEAKVYILGIAISIYLLKKGIFSLHGSTIYKKNKGLTFAGTSGAGKSTMVTYFIDNGYYLVADDVSRIELPINSAPKVHPGISQVRLWPDSVLALNRDPQSLPLVVNKLDKRRLAIEKISPSAVELSAIILLKPSPVDQPRLYQLKGEERFLAIAENIYGVRIIPFLRNYAEHFQFCTALVNKVPVYCLERPIGKFALDSIYSLVESTLNLK